MSKEEAAAAATRGRDTRRRPSLMRVVCSAMRISIQSSWLEKTLNLSKWRFETFLKRCLTQPLCTRRHATISASIKTRLDLAFLFVLLCFTLLYLLGSLSHNAHDGFGGRRVAAPCSMYDILLADEWASRVSRWSARLASVCIASVMHRSWPMRRWEVSVLV
ncbi:hypothetical protein B0J15DRAFT_179725 [Fusarium solani]|jgi:hypothetical protein|uniref:Uncharacterized protein n=1 Tax=Fusarium solani TaxID=169388 RepID=A0A9P9L1L9_FUSSL|nr:uncharacterized protein B0J15DRAFT_179725 [Fusarium solani]KAH7272506.1 hypothetical protein B0J15DRAFT_179725 [Fusarium solani]